MIAISGVVAAVALMFGSEFAYIAVSESSSDSMSKAYWTGIWTNVGSAGVDAFLLGLISAGIVGYVSSRESARAIQAKVEAARRAARPVILAELLDGKKSKLDLSGVQIGPGVIDCDIRGVAFASETHRSAKLRNITFQGVNIEDVTFAIGDRESMLEDVVFENCKIKNVKMAGAMIVGYGVGVQLVAGGSCRSLDLSRSVLVKARLEGLPWGAARLWGAILDGPILSKDVHQRLVAAGLVQNVAEGKVKIAHPRELAVLRPGRLSMASLGKVLRAWQAVVSWELAYLRRHKVTDLGRD